MKERTSIPTGRVEHDLRTRLNPIRHLTPSYLTNVLDEYGRGELERPARLFETVCRRDDMLAAVVPKRKKAISEHGWQVVLKDGIAGGGQGERAERHKRAVQFALNHVCATNALRPNYRRGWGGVVRNMLEAVGTGYSANETIWKFVPGADGGVTTDFRFVPLHLFEARTGPLRFLIEQTNRDGVPLDDGEWMVAIDDGLLEATTIAYLYKTMPLRDWIIFSERFGFGGVLGYTDATIDSPEFSAFSEAVAQFMNDFNAVISGSGRIEFPNMQSGAKGSLPFPALVDRIDRVMSTLWRGGDLASLSNRTSEAGQGSERQKGEGEIIVYDDKCTIEDTLNAKWLPWVTRYAVGDEMPLVEIRIPMPNAERVDEQLRVDQLFFDMGVPLSAEQLRKLYGRDTPGDDADAVVNTPPPADNSGVEAELRRAREAFEASDDGPAMSDQMRTGRSSRSPRVPLPNEAPSLRSPSASRRQTFRDLMRNFLRRPVAELPNEIAPDELRTFRDAARFQLEDARRRDLSNLEIIITDALETETPAEMRAALAGLDEMLPEFVSATANQVAALEAVIASAYVNGLADLEDNQEPDSII